MLNNWELFYNTNSFTHCYPFCIEIVFSILNLSFPWDGEVVGVYFEIKFYINGVRVFQFHHSKMSGTIFDFSANGDGAFMHHIQNELFKNISVAYSLKCCKEGDEIIIKVTLNVEEDKGESKTVEQSYTIQI